jgi:hypothetical protein
MTLWTGEPAGLLGPLSVSAATNFRSLPDRGLNHGAGRQALDELEITLVQFAPLLFAQTLPRKRFLGPAFLAGFHVEAMLLDFLDDVFLLHLALETAQGIFQ